MLALRVASSRPCPARECCRHWASAPIALVLTGLVALIHVYIVILEMVRWATPRGRAAFGPTPEFAAETKVLAANQGLYNGFLAVGALSRWSGRGTSASLPECSSSGASSSPASTGPRRDRGSCSSRRSPRALALGALFLAH